MGHLWSAILAAIFFFFWCCSHFRRFYSNQFDFFFHLFGFTASTFGPSDYYLDRTRFVLLGIFFFLSFSLFFCRLPEHLWGVAVIFCSAIFYRLGILGEFYCLFFFWWPAIDVLDTSFTRFVFFFYRVSPIWVSSFYWLAPGSAEVHQVFSWIFFLTSWPFSFWWWSRLLRWPTGAQFYWDSLGRIENKKNVHVLTERLRISEN